MSEDSPSVRDPESLQSLDERISEAQDLVRQAQGLKDRHVSTDKVLRELSEIWSDNRAQEYRERFEASKEQAELFLRCAVEYEGFLLRLAQAREFREDGQTQSKPRRGKKGG
ncbi:MAG: hypothetical protein FGM37_01830 [Phycisphaerales bacterium]|nr:hypothetical protein [Phycisphaerales bacterium]